MSRPLAAVAVALLLGTACTAEQKVENVIFYIGDGMGWGAVSTLVMQHMDKAPQEVALYRMDNAGAATTYSMNAKVTDSAAGGTALATGEKTKNSMVGINAAGDTLRSVLMKAQDAGKTTGIVVNTALVDATPAAFYGHVTKRYDWEELAMQMLTANVDFYVGAGLPSFNQRADSVSILPLFEKQGYLVCNQWDQAKNAQADKMLAVFDNSMEGLPADILNQAVTKTLSLIDAKANSKGFFLMIEEAQIDHWGHDNNAEGMKAEMEHFNNTLTTLLDYADAHPGTLVVVTADHETGGVMVDNNGEPLFSLPSHSGSLVPVFAYGPGAENFSGLMDNTDIPHKILSLLGL